jgi:hypothetical protein
MTFSCLDPVEEQCPISEPIGHLTRHQSSQITSEENIWVDNRWSDDSPPVLESNDLLPGASADSIVVLRRYGY